MSPLAQHAADTASLAWSASDNNTIDAFLASPEWLAFLAAAEAATYIYSELELPLNDTSVRNAAEQAAQFAHSVYDNETASDTVAAREAEALTARVAAAEPAPRTRYLDDAELDHLVLTAKALRKGRKLAAYAGGAYLVIVDGDYLWLRDVKALRKTLSSCYLNWAGVVPFRNYDGGVTFNLDQPREAAREAVRAAVPVWVEQEEQEQQAQAKALPVPPKRISKSVVEVVRPAPDFGHPDVVVEVTTSTWLHNDGRLSSTVNSRILRSVVPAPKADPDFLGGLAFIAAIEDGSITDAQFDASAQAFVDGGTWRSLQGSWGRAVESWAAEGLVNL